MKETRSRTPRAAAMRRARAALPASLLVLALWTAPCAAASWQAAPGSRLAFTGSSQGEEFTGHFGRFSARIRFDPAAPDQAQFEVVVDTGSVDSANEERDQTLVTGDFFDVERHAQARWTATGARASGDGFIADGELSLRGVQQPVPLSFRFTRTETGAMLEGRAILDRVAFGVGSGDWADPDVIAHEVSVRTRLLLRPAGE